MPISTHNIRELWGHNFYRHSANLILFVTLTFCWNVISKKNVKSRVFEVWKNVKYVFSNTSQKYFRGREKWVWHAGTWQCWCWRGGALLSGVLGVKGGVVRQRRFGEVWEKSVWKGGTWKARSVEVSRNILTPEIKWPSVIASRCDSGIKAHSAGIEDSVKLTYYLNKQWIMGEYDNDLLDEMLDWPAVKLFGHKMTRGQKITRGSVYFLTPATPSHK